MNPNDELEPKLINAASNINSEYDTIIKGIRQKELLRSHGYTFFSHTFVKNVLFGMEEKFFCPRKVLLTVLEKKAEDIKTVSMLKGSYFETLVIGCGKDGEKTRDLPRKKIRVRKKAAAEETEKLPAEQAGEKTIDQLRIDMQAKRALILFHNYKMQVYPGVNTQVKVFKHIDKSRKMLLECNLDIFPTGILYKGKEYCAVIDVKLTGNINNTFGEFCWGVPDEIDHTQAYLYLYVTDNIDFNINPHLKELLGNRINMPNKIFFYFVFDYKRPEDELGFIPIEVEWNESRREETRFITEKALAIYDYETEREWPAIGEYETCRHCPENVMNRGTCQHAVNSKTV